MSLERRLSIMRWACLGMAASSFMLGGWMLLQPNGFWTLMGAPAAGEGGMAVSTRVVYGGAILGESVALLLVFSAPVRYMGFLHYMMAYKSIACIALAAWIMPTMSSPSGGWIIVLGWATAGIIAAAIYPWGRWDDILRHHCDRDGGNT